MTTTNTAKHTAGDWHDVYRFTPDRKRMMIVAKDGTQIAQVRLDVGPMEAEANAHLIAAAPELLKALEHAADFMGEMCHPDDLLSMARAAIAKAKGETP